MEVLSIYNVMPMINILVGAWVFVSKRKHLLNVLLSLEFTMLSIFWLMCSTVSLLSSECYFILFFLALGACEGALGLSILVSVVRTHGNDCFSVFSVLEC